MQKEKFPYEIFLCHAFSLPIQFYVWRCYGLLSGVNFQQDWIVQRMVPWERGFSVEVELNILVLLFFFKSGIK